jgi:hypothetical protein
VRRSRMVEGKYDLSADILPIALARRFPSTTPPRVAVPLPTLRVGRRGLPPPYFVR